jgi:hypothetical protein
MFATGQALVIRPPLLLDRCTGINVTRRADLTGNVLQGDTLDAELAIAINEMIHIEFRLINKAFYCGNATSGGTFFASALGGVSGKYKSPF